MTRRLWIVISVLVLLGIALYAAIFSQSKDEASVRFVTSAVMQSKAVGDYVGGIREVRVPLAGPYGEEEQGDLKRAQVTLEVTGSKRTATVTGNATFIRGQWSLNRLSIDGKEVPVQQTGTTNR